MFRKAKQVANGTWRPPQESFMQRTLEQTAILIETFKMKSHEYPNNFWRQMTLIMKTEAGSSPIPIEQLYSLYSSSEAHVLNTLLTLLSG